MDKNNSVTQAVCEAISAGPFGPTLSLLDVLSLFKDGSLREAQPAQQLCAEHQPGDRIFFVISGEVEVSEDVEGESVTLARLGPGDLFGEIAALFGVPRISTVTAKRRSLLLELSGAALTRLMTRAPRFRESVLERYRIRTTDAALRAVPLFSFLPEPALAVLRDAGALLNYAVGAEVLKQGEPGEALFIVAHGRAAVSHRSGGEVRRIAELGPGDYFGEWSVLTGAPRSATVTALTTMCAVRIERGIFLDFLQRNPMVRDRLDLLAHNRRGSDLLREAI